MREPITQLYDHHLLEIFEGMIRSDYENGTFLCAWTYEELRTEIFRRMIEAR